MRELVDVRIETDPYEETKKAVVLVFEGGITVSFEPVEIDASGLPPSRWTIRSHPAHERDGSGYIAAAPGAGRMTMSQVIARATAVPDALEPPTEIDPPGGLKRPRRNYKNGRPPHK